VFFSLHLQTLDDIDTADIAIEELAGIARLGARLYFFSCIAYSSARSFLPSRQQFKAAGCMITSRDTSRASQVSNVSLVTAIGDDAIIYRRVKL
jgi:hypothetical protein